MPWTFAHAAAVIPLKKIFPKKLHFLGLVIGSFTPDFGYYIGQTHLSHFSHSFSGLFLACIPIGIFLTYFLSLMGKYFSIILPEPHRFAFYHLTCIEKIESLKELALLPIAVFIGSLTHIVWDSFTHAGRWGVVHIEILKNEAFRIGTLIFYGHSLMQYLSSIVGAAIILWIYINWLKKNNLTFFTRDPEEYWRYKLIAFLIILSLIASFPIAYFHTNHISGALAINAFVVDLAFVFIPVFFISVIVSALYLKHVKKLPIDKNCSNDKEMH